MKKNIKTALIIIDLQNDFINGNLEIPYSNNLINKINKIQNKFDLVCFSKNISVINKKIKKDDIKICDTDQYCIDGTNGADFPDELKINDNIFVRSYDYNFNALKSKKDDKYLFDFLKENEITHLFLCGLQGDYSIKYTSMESIKSFKSYVIIDLIKNIYNMDHTIKFMLKRKINFLNSNDIDIFINGINNEFQKNKKINKKTKKSFSDFVIIPRR